MTTVGFHVIDDFAPQSLSQCGPENYKMVLYMVQKCLAGYKSVDSFRSLVHYRALGDIRTVGSVPLVCSLVKPRDKS